MPLVQIAGLPAPIELSVPFRQELIPKGQTFQRPGHRFTGGTPDRYIQHDTGNRGVGANAAMHSRYLHQGAPDRYGNAQQLGYHLTVDDRECVQMIPLDEGTWHGGDGGGPCNFDAIACELCINADGNEMKARANAERVAAAIMGATGAKLGKHQDCAGKWCPQDMLGDGYWPIFVARVAEIQSGQEPGKRYADPTPLPVGEWDGYDRDIGGTRLLACRRMWRCLQDTPVLQVASLARGRDLRGRLPTGGEFLSEYLFRGGGIWWAYTRWGSRIPITGYADDRWELLAAA